MSKEKRATNNPPHDNRAPLTEEEIRAHTIGELKAESGGIVIEEYDARWAEVFGREAVRIRSVLGSSALRIEHVGSTSVAGLSAKPIIDMVLVVNDSAKEDKYVPALEAAGFLLRIRESDWNEHRMFNGPEAEINLHVFSSGCAEIERMVMFRDWLRENAADRDLYAWTKRELARKKWKYVQNYADAKSGVIQEIIGRAKRR